MKKQARHEPTFTLRVTGHIDIENAASTSTIPSFTVALLDENDEQIHSTTTDNNLYSFVGIDPNLLRSGKILFFKTFGGQSQGLWDVEEVKGGDVEPHRNGSGDLVFLLEALHHIDRGNFEIEIQVPPVLYRLRQIVQPTVGTIKGTIAIQLAQGEEVSEEGCTLCCIKVTLRDGNGKWIADECTDVTGKFTFTGLSFGTYQLIYPESIDYQDEAFVPDRSHFEATISTVKPDYEIEALIYHRPSTGLIQGYIIDADGQTVNSVPVEVFDLQGNQMPDSPCTSEPNGHFELPVPAGRYLVRFPETFMGSNGKRWSLMSVAQIAIEVTIRKTTPAEVYSIYINPDKAGQRQFEAFDGLRQAFSDGFEKLSFDLNKLAPQRELIRIDEPDWVQTAVDEIDGLMAAIDEIIEDAEAAQDNADRATVRKFAGYITEAEAVKDELIIWKGSLTSSQELDGLTAQSWDNLEAENSTRLDSAHSILDQLRDGLPQQP